jgi:hypothetical protein
MRAFRPIRVYAQMRGIEKIFLGFVQNQRIALRSRRNWSESAKKFRHCRQRMAYRLT